MVIHKRNGDWSSKNKAAWCGAEVSASEPVVAQWKTVDCPECLASKEVGFPGLKRGHDGRLVRTVSEALKGIDT